MSLVLMLALQAASPMPQAPDVVVVGDRIRRHHEQCVRGECTPLRDAQVSIAWAETQFRDGRYVDAKRTLAAATARNKRHAATHPKPVAALYEAYATVAWQEGDQDVYRDAVADQVRTLRDHLPADDNAVRTAALALGEMWLRLGKLLEAERAFAQADREATSAGRDDVALRARVARARLKRLLGDRKEAAALLASAEALPIASKPGPKSALAAMRLRFAALDGDEREIDRLVVTRSPGAVSTVPVLIWAPDYPRTAIDLANNQRGSGNSATSPSSGNGEFSPLPNGLTASSSDLATIKWMDVGFWIRPDGRTAEIEFLRGSTDKAWTKPYLAQVSSRRYAPLTTLAADEPGMYRIERFTLRPNYVVPQNSHIRRRAGAGKLEVLDLTDPSAKVTASR